MKRLNKTESPILLLKATFYMFISVCFSAQQFPLEKMSYTLKENNFPLTVDSFFQEGGTLF